MADQELHTGGCECGAVRYKAEGPLRDITACHCGQCQRSSGHHYAATAANDKDFTLIKDDGLKWYKSSNWAERGFCDQCGSNLFWRMNGRDSISILSGSLDDQNTGLKITAHYFVADKKDYYDIADAAPQYQSYPEELKQRLGDIEPL